MCQQDNKNEYSYRGCPCHEGKYNRRGGRMPIVSPHHKQLCMMYMLLHMIQHVYFPYKNCKVPITTLQKLEKSRLTEKPTIA